MSSPAAASPAAPAEARLRPRPGSLRREILKHRWCYVFVLPSLVLAGMFTFYPMVMSWYYSFLDWTGVTSARTWVGLANYVELIHDPMFWAAFGRSFLFVAVAVPLRLGLSLLVAMALNGPVLRMASAFRTFFFIPVVMSAAITGVIMQFVLSSYKGPMNGLLQALGIIDAPVDFLGDPGTALWAVIAVQVWKDFGITMIYWLAALQTVPTVYYEAARIDGAGRWEILRHITLPIILPFVLIITLLTVNGTLHVFGIVQAMTGGGPYFSTQVIETYIYQTAFSAGDVNGGVPRLGYASAAGVFFGVAVMVIAAVQLWAARRAGSMRSDLGEA
ncbi:carbohydrate ABC transporter permease [Brachybacterium hainanense]|uniref:Carbohydrate ABC transporter permease n=1 Tax=Brachybacterium hainanense TaxID=1541174 RepID=A0ABV6RDJ6_9MICO